MLPFAILPRHAWQRALAFGEYSIDTMVGVACVFVLVLDFGFFCRGGIVFRIYRYDVCDPSQSDCEVAGIQY